MAIFDKKTWNDAVFQKYLKKVPNLKENSLLKNGVLETNQSLKARLVDGVGGNTLIEPITGLLDGDYVNYDGSTNITTSERGTFQQKKIVVGRAKGWDEKDFSTELTGVNWMEGVAGEVGEYWQGVDMETILAILKGIFSMTSTQGKAFAEKHTYTEDGKIGVTTINNAGTKAFGDKKNKFISMAFMHSTVAGTLENLQILDYLKYTDPKGVQSNIEIAQVGNKIVIVDDEMPVESGYYTSTAGEDGALKVIASGSPQAGEILLSTVKASDFYPSNVAADSYVVAGERYTTYLLGKGAIEYCDCGAKVPSEVARDAAEKGGIDKLYTRQRKLYAPKWISWEGASSIISPTKEQLETGSNWDIVNNGETSSSNKIYVNQKMIPFGRIYTRG